MTCPFDSKPRWERRKDARPQELLAAALDLFVERGFAATRLEDVARRAGVSKGTLYLYFANKEDLFKAVVRENIVTSIGEAEEFVAGFNGATADLFRQLILHWWRNVGSTKAAGLSKLMMAEAGNFPELANFYHEEVIARSDAMFAQMLARGAARGELRELNDLHTIRVLVAPMLMLMMWQHSFGPCGGPNGKDQLVPELYLERFIDICLNGLLQAPGSAKLGS